MLWYKKASCNEATWATESQAGSVSAAEPDYRGQLDRTSPDLLPRQLLEVGQRIVAHTRHHGLVSPQLDEEKGELLRLEHRFGQDRERVTWLFAPLTEENHSDWLMWTDNRKRTSWNFIVCCPCNASQKYVLHFKSVFFFSKLVNYTRFMKYYF